MGEHTAADHKLCSCKHNMADPNSPLLWDRENGIRLLIAQFHEQL